MASETGQISPIPTALLLPLPRVGWSYWGLARRASVFLLLLGLDIGLQLVPGNPSHKLSVQTP